MTDDFRLFVGGTIRFCWPAPDKGIQGPNLWMSISLRVEIHSRQTPSANDRFSPCAGEVAAPASPTLIVRLIAADFLSGRSLVW